MWKYNSLWRYNSHSHRYCLAGCEKKRKTKQNKNKHLQIKTKYRCTTLYLLILKAHEMRFWNGILQMLKAQESVTYCESVSYYESAAYTFVFLLHVKGNFWIGMC